jgi:hypothetical protein
MELSEVVAVLSSMGGVREYKVELVGAAAAPKQCISILAATPIIALYQGAALAYEMDARDFVMLPGKRANWPYRY